MMRYRILMEQDTDGPLSSVEIKLFKYLNSKKKKGVNILDLIKTMLPFFNIPKSEANYYLKLYSANYRPDGDYENITTNNFVDIRDVKPTKTSNQTAYEFTSGKIPFKGSNLNGYWDNNTNGDKYYVVKSYDWYPIFLFIHNQWFQVLDNYSSSTSKHISHSNPIRYNSGLGEKVRMATPNELKMLIRGKSPDDIFNERVPNFVNKVNNGEIKFKNVPTLRTIWGTGRVKYTVTDVKEENGKIVIDVKINKAGQLVDRKMVEKPELYDDEQFMSNIKNGVESEILQTQNRYLTRKNTEFRFH